MRGGPGFHGTLANVDVSSDPDIDHINIDKSPRLHERVVAEVLAVIGSHKTAPAKNGNGADTRTGRPATLPEQDRQNHPAPRPHKPPAGTSHFRYRIRCARIAPPLAETICSQGQPTSALGQKQTLGKVRLISALPPKADIGTQPHVHFVPITDIGHKRFGTFDLQSWLLFFDRLRAHVCSF
jgi:hypothetical protein